MPNIFDLNGNCTGCAACSVICPKKAIKMQISDDGFFEPQINLNNCINCGQCQNVCHKNLNTFSFNETKKIFYAAYSTDDNIRLNCSSGGVAFEMCRYAIQNGFYIVGCVYDKNTDKAILNVTNKIEHLNNFRNSKYLQSDNKIALFNSLNLAKQGKKILYIGTPCQVYGAKMAAKLFGLEDMFIFVDFYCHGVPSYLLWDKHLSEIGFKPGEIDFVSFRDKQNGWHNTFNLTIKSKEKSYRKNALNDNFYNFYFDNVCFQKSCYDCDFRKGESVADIKIGDFWGRKFKSNKDGISLIRTNSEKGDQFFNSVETLCIEREMAEPDDLKYQSSNEYSEREQRSFCIEQLKTNNSLKQINKTYRKQFSRKRRIKTKFKKIAFNLLPIKVYDYLRRIFA